MHEAREQVQHLALRGRHRDLGKVGRGARRARGRERGVLGHEPPLDVVVDASPEFLSHGGACLGLRRATEPATVPAAYGRGARAARQCRR